MEHTSPKTIDELMERLNSKGIYTNGDEHRQVLRNMGYYHGYKGYRYYGRVEDTLQYDDFEQLEAVYEFDKRIKRLLYRWVVFLETALKNFTLEVVVEGARSESFEAICKSVLVSPTSKPELLPRFYQSIYDAIDGAYNNKRPVVTHFYNNKEPIPIWALFEIITIGNFGAFLECLEPQYRVKLSQSIELPHMKDIDRDCELPQHLVFALRDLRNAIAHDAPIFDVRFNLNNRNLYNRKKKATESEKPNRTVHSRVGEYMKRQTEMMRTESDYWEWEWDNIADYVLLIAQLLMHFREPNSQIREKVLERFLSDYEWFREKVPDNIAEVIVPQKGLDKVKQYARNNCA